MDSQSQSYSQTELQKVKEFATKIFNEKFFEKFYMNIREHGLDPVQNLLIEAIEYSAMVFFLEEVREYHNIEGSIEGNNMAELISQFLVEHDNKDLNALMNEFIQTYMIRVALKFAESFETGTKARTMRLDHHATFQIGWEHQTLSSFFIAPYFLLTEFVKNNYELDNMKLFKYFVYNPYGAKSQDLVQDMEQVLAGYKLKDIVNTILNGLGPELLNNLDNWREGDFISILMEGVGLFSTECKNSHDSDSTYLKDVAVDVFSTVFVAMCRSVALNEINIEDQFEQITVALDPDNEAAIKEFIVDPLISIRTPSDMRASAFDSQEEVLEGEGKRKYFKFIELYSTVSEMINTEIVADRQTSRESFMSELVKLFKDSGFTSVIKGKIREIFGENKEHTQVDEIFERVQDILQINSIQRWLGSGGSLGPLAVLDKLLVQDIDGVYKLSFENIFYVYQATDVKITSEIIDKVAFFVVDGIKKTPSQLTSSERERIKSGNLAIVHDDSDSNGLILVDTPQIDYSRIAAVVRDGYIAPSGEIIKGIMPIRKGYILSGIVSLNIEDGSFLVKTKEDLAHVLAESITKTDIENSFFPELDHHNNLEYIRSSVLEVGSKVTYTIQAVHSKIFCTNAHEKIVSTYTASKLLYEEQVTSLNLDAIKVYKKELAGLFSLIYFIDELYNEQHEYNVAIFPGNLEEFYWFNVHGGQIIYGFLQLHGFTDIRPYTKEYIQNLLETLSPTSGDLKNMNPVYSPNAKVYYDTFRRLIIDKIDSPFFTEFENLLIQNGQPRVFSSGSGLNDADFLLIKDMEYILQKVFSHSGYALISMGILSFKGDYTIETNAISRQKLGIIFNKFGLSLKFDSSRLTSPSFFQGMRYPIENVFITMALFGFSRILDVGGRLKSFNVFPSRATLETLFNNYRFDTTKRHYYNQRCDEILNLYNDFLENSGENDAISFIFEEFFSIKEIEISLFLRFFEYQLEDLPFGVFNERTVIQFINYYGLNWEIKKEGVQSIIVNQDYIPSEFKSINLINTLKVLDKIFRNGYELTAEFLESILKIDKMLISTIISRYKRTLRVVSYYDSDLKSWIYFRPRV